jgi:F-type H+-transporting ATPase subunit epsilon
MAFELEIVTPVRRLWSGTVEHVRAPGSEGGFGVLSGHHPLLTSLGTGALRFREPGSQERTAAISGGFAEVLRDKVTILAETAELPEEIDVARAEAARDRARRRLTRPISPDVDVARAQAALIRALNRLKAAGR